MAVRLPKAMIRQMNIKNTVELELSGQTIIIRAVPDSNIRSGWADSFKKIGSEETSGPVGFIDAQLDSWDDEEWTW